MFRLSFRFVRQVLTTIALAGVPAVAFAPATVEAKIPSVGKVAMVDMQRVLNETTAGKKARKSLESSSTAKQKKFDKRRAQLEADAAKLRSLKGDQLAKAQEKLQQESMELQNMLMASERDLSNEHNKLLEQMYRNSQEIVEKLAREKGIDLVLVRDQMTVIYAKGGLDITAEVVKAYNKKHPK